MMRHAVLILCGLYSLAAAISLVAAATSESWMVAIWIVTAILQIITAGIHFVIWVAMCRRDEKIERFRKEWMALHIGPRDTEQVAIISKP